jgi:hypothetical protein
MGVGEIEGLRFTLCAVGIPSISSVMLASVTAEPVAPTLNLIATAPSEFQLDAQPTQAGRIRRTRDMTEITACLCGSSVLPSQQNAQTTVQCTYRSCETSWMRILLQVVCYGIAYS